LTSVYDNVSFYDYFGSRSELQIKSCNECKKEQVHSHAGEV